MEPGCQILEIRKRIAIRSSGQIEAAVIAARPPRAVRLGDKMKRRRPRAIGAAYNTSRLQLSKFRLGLLETEGIKAAGFGKNRRAGGVDMMLDTMGRGKILKI